VGNILQAAQGKDSNAASEFIGFAGRYTPGSSLWYARLGLERLIIDQGKLWVDSDTRTKMRRNASKYRTQYGQKYWWSQGDILPERTPALSNVFE
jgi:hypothetical protein